MPYELTYDADAACLICRMSGEFHASELRQFGSKVVALLKEHGCVRLLTDMRGVDLRLSTIDLYSIPKLVTEAGVQPNVRRAIVFDASAEDYKFLETTAINRGQAVRVFTDFDEAKRWITHSERS